MPAPPRPSRFLQRWLVLQRWLAAGLALSVVACTPGDRSPTAGSHIRHLTLAVADSDVRSASAPPRAAQSRRWDFPAARARWSPLSQATEPWLAAIELAELEDGLGLALDVPQQRPTMLL
ncbi:MAG: hypothetical protein R3244_08900, partial [Thermoanaerobaculia bacterium]|nr:hypothetical protein [Thermoanaerobaculia bacterium]